jgi:hypothetical protein
LSKCNITLPDEKNLTLPSGYLGVTFAGKHPEIAAIEDDSPLKDQFCTGMVIDMLCLPDGTLYLGLLSIELANVLRGSAILEECNVYLVNPKTMKLTEKAIDARSSTAGAITHDIGIVTGDISGVATPGNAATTIANTVSYDAADIGVAGS